MTEVEGSPRSLKRDHDSFEELGDLEEPCSVPANYLEMIESQRDKQDPAEESLPTPPVSVGTKRDPSPARSTTDSLTDAETTTPSHQGQSPMPNVPPPSILTSPSASSACTAVDGTAPPPQKKTKLSLAERESRRTEKKFKNRQRAEEKARKEAEKEAERKKREAGREEKRVAQEAEKAAKEEKRRQKEEEKRKKERSQMKLGNFFTIPAATKPRGSSVDSRGRSSSSPAPPNSNPSLSAAVASPAALTLSKPGLSTYDRQFPAFFVQSGVTLAPISRFERDEDALNSIQNAIDAYILGNRSPGRERVFDPVAFFHLPSRGFVPRGKYFMPVREIMSEFYSGNVMRPIDLTTDSQNTQIKRTGDLLRKIPMKFLKFQEDVRPPYRGTYTNRPVTGMTKLARNPLRKDLPNTDYDYDSEAEWIEDEDAEDLKSEGEEDEEVDDDEDMDGFLDDENDETANSRRLVLQGDLEPVSTGLCWEDRKRRNSNIKMMPYRMEVILDPTIKSIDPFSRAYWEPVQTAMEPPRIPLNTMKNASVNVNAPTSSAGKTVKPLFTTVNDVFKAAAQSTAQPHPQSKPAKDTKPKKLIAPEDFPAFCAAIQGSDLSKVGLIEVLKKKFPGRSAAAIKATLETIARREGVKEVDKRWRLLDSSQAQVS